MAGNRICTTGQTIEFPEQFDQFTAKERLDYMSNLLEAAYGLKRIAKELLTSVDTPEVVTRIVTNPNCFALAALQYGDIRNWSAVMNASNLTTPILSGNTDIRLPENPQRLSNR